MGQVNPAEQKIGPAADGRFFGGFESSPSGISAHEPLTVAGEIALNHYLREQKPAIREASDILEHINEASRITDTHSVRPELIRKTELEKAQETLERRQKEWIERTDLLSRTTAVRFPNLTLPHRLASIYDGVIMSSSDSLYEENSDGVWVYRSSVTKEEQEAGIQPADQVMWSVFLFQAMTNRPQPRRKPVETIELGSGKFL